MKAYPILLVLGIVLFFQEKQKPELTDETFKKWLEYILPNEEESKWRLIPWRVSFWDAVIEAHEKNMPLLIWAMNGHPLGETWNNGLRGRQFVWMDKRVQEISKKFIPVADEVHYLQSKKGPECDLFRKIAEQGYRGGKTKPTPTRQGVYIALPNGMHLISGNYTEADGMLNMLKKGIEKWEKLTDKEKNCEDEFNPLKSPRFGISYPKDGLVLRVNSRDLPREKKFDGWRAGAWNQDFAWFKNKEAKDFVPSRLEKGIKEKLPAYLIERLVCAHLIDNVRGQTLSYEKKHVEKAELVAEITLFKENIVSLGFEGFTLVSAKGKWSVNGFKDMDKPSDQKRGFEAKLLGKAEFDTKKKIFVSFELVAIGKRWGATQYNGRADDLDSAPMGIALTLAGDDPSNRIMPAHIWNEIYQSYRSN